MWYVPHLTILRQRECQYVIQGDKNNEFYQLYKIIALLFSLRSGLQ